MERSEQGSFKIAELSELLHVSMVTAFEISKDPILNRKKVAGQYRILKRDFWKWYVQQDKYSVYEETYDPNEFFTTADIADMLQMTLNDANKLVCRKKLRSNVSTRRVLVKKKDFFDWYANQLYYRSNDPRLPKQWFGETYEIGEIKKKLGVKSRNTIYHLYKRDLFDVKKIGCELRVDKESFDQWYATREVLPSKKKRGGST